MKLQMKTPKSILIVEDEKHVSGMIHRLLSKEGYIVDVVQNGQEALNKFKNSSYDLVISDVCMPVMGGIDLLKELRKNSYDAEVVLITGFGKINDAVEAMKHGASDYITKPVSNKELNLRVRRVFEKQSLVNEVVVLHKALEDRYSFGNIIGKSKKMRELYEIISTVSTTDANILITGDTGTGKELVAKAIHFNSLRNEKPFVPINCAALPDNIIESELFGHEPGSFTGAVRRRVGRFEFCSGGTIFLDEIASMPLSIQAKLLRVLQERKVERLGSNESINVDVRIVTATNKDLTDMVNNGKFREDLFFRLNVIPINIPPLSERKEDIPLLANHFLEKYNKTNKKDIKRVSEDVLNTLISYDWPGNVREFENVFERAVIMAKKDIIGELHLPVDFCTALMREGPKATLVNEQIISSGLQIFIENCEKEYLTKVLQKCNGNVKVSAEYAKTEEKTFYRRMKKYNLAKDDFKIRDGISGYETFLNDQTVARR